MRITQANVTAKFFRDSFMAKFGMTQYVSRKHPVIFFGCYRKNFDAVFRHRALCVIIWAGSDSLNLLREPAIVDAFKRKRNIKHISISNFISSDLARVGLPYIYLPIVPFDNSSFKPVPLGTKVYVYSAHLKPELYGASLVKKVISNFPGIDFITLHAQPPASVSRDKIHTIYAQCACALRLTEHDGLSNTVIEMGLMGRRCIWNGIAPNSIPWKNIIDICYKLENELKRPKTIDLALAEKVRKFIDIDTKFLNTEFYE